MPRDSNCWHCGEPLAGSVVAHATVAGQKRAMCCQGCRLDLLRGVSTQRVGDRLHREPGHRGQCEREPDRRRARAATDGRVDPVAHEDVEQAGRAGGHLPWLHPDEDLPVAFLAREGLDGFGGRRADRLAGLQVEGAPVAGAADTVVAQLARGQQAVQMRAVVRGGVGLAVEPRHGELVKGARIKARRRPERVRERELAPPHIVAGERLLIVDDQRALRGRIRHAEELLGGGDRLFIDR